MIFSQNNKWRLFYSTRVIAQLNNCTQIQIRGKNTYYAWEKYSSPWMYSPFIALSNGLMVNII